MVLLSVNVHNFVFIIKISINFIENIFQMDLIYNKCLNYREFNQFISQKLLFQIQLTVIRYSMNFYLVFESFEYQSKFIEMFKYSVLIAIFIYPSIRCQDVCPQIAENGIYRAFVSIIEWLV